VYRLLYGYCATGQVVSCDSTLAITRNYLIDSSPSLMTREWHLTGYHPTWVVFNSKGKWDQWLPRLHSARKVSLKDQTLVHFCWVHKFRQCPCYRCLRCASPWICRRPHASPVDGLWPSSVSYKDNEMCSGLELLVYLHLSATQLFLVRSCRIWYDISV